MAVLMKLKVGTNSSQGPLLARAFLWWLDLPQTLPRTQFPRTWSEMALECNRTRGTELGYVREYYGFIFSVENQAAAQTLKNVALKAGLPLTKLS